MLVKKYKAICKTQKYTCGNDIVVSEVNIVSTSNACMLFSRNICCDVKTFAKKLFKGIMHTYLHNKNTNGKINDSVMSLCLILTLKTVKGKFLHFK